MIRPASSCARRWQFCSPSCWRSFRFSPAPPTNPCSPNRRSASRPARSTPERRSELRHRPEYYLYKGKFKFSAEPATVELGEPQLPAGEVKDDEFFGRVETYRGQLRFTVPVNAAEGIDRFTLTVTSQGCADMGICYPPTPRAPKSRSPAVPRALARAGSCRARWANPRQPIARPGWRRHRQAPPHRLQRALTSRHRSPGCSANRACR